MSLQNSSLKRAKIMTGKGSGVVQKIVVKYLKQAGYQWAFEKLSNGKDNTGVLVLFLD
jgi:dsDNA-specific endonuclease/ATPase MutS2